MRNIYMGNGNYFEDLENKKNKEERIIHNPNLNTEELFKSGEVSFTVSESLNPSIFKEFDTASNHQKQIEDYRIKKAADELVNKIINYCDEVLPPQTIKEIEDKFKEDDFECEYVYFDLTFIRFLNILRGINTKDSKTDRLSKISKLINYLESKPGIKEEYLLTAHELKQSILSLKDIEEGLIHYVFKIIETHFQCSN